MYQQVDQLSRQHREELLREAAEARLARLARPARAASMGHGNLLSMVKLRLGLRAISQP